MKKKVVTVLLSCIIAVSVTACGSSGVSQEEYDKVVAERDDLQAQLDALTSSSSVSESSQNNASDGAETLSTSDEGTDQQEYSIGETWEVDGKFKVTVNSVTESDYRNEFDESNPAATYIVTYTYENIGLNDDLYVDLSSQIVDASGKMGTSYPGDITMYPQAVPTGASCEAQACIAVDNPGSFKDYVSIYDDDFNEYSAVFTLDIQ